MANQITKELDSLGRVLLVQLQNELKARGHKGTGSLIQGIQFEVVRDGLVYELVCSYPIQGQFLETGLSPKQIKFPFARARIEALKEWAKRKRLTSGLDRDLESFARAIAYNHSKKGFTLRGKSAFSASNRKGWQTAVLDRESQYILNQIQDIQGGLLDGEIDLIIQKIVK